MKEKSVVYYLSLEDIKDENILFNYIYANLDSNYYISDDLSAEFYILQAVSGFIATSINLENKFYLVPEMQFEYAILDFENLHISKKVKKLLDKKDFIFTINKNLDEVVKNKEDVQALGIQNGDYIAYDPKTEITASGFIKSRFLDDKMSVAILFGMLKYLANNHIKPKHNLIIIISTYEEVGHGSSYIHPDIDELIAVDMGCIGEDLACSEYDVSICAKDGSGPYDYDLTSKLIELASTHQLQYAIDIYPYYSSDVSAALRGGQNIKGALIGPGVAASHGMERTHLQAVENTLKLLLAYIA